jgi:arsenate reductase
LWSSARGWRIPCRVLNRTTMTITIYHNPNCSNSRGALQILAETGADIRIIEYLKTPLTKPELQTLAARLEQTAGGAWTVRDMMRTKEPIYSELSLENAGDDALLAALATHPILLNRPIVVTDAAALMCRPPELVRGLLS